MAIRLIISRRDGRGVEAPSEQTFDGPLVTIGNDPAASLHLEDRAVAPEQAIIIGGGGEEPLFINRADGTLLNGEPLAREARRPLTDGDRITVGPYDITFANANGFRPNAAPPELELEPAHEEAARADNVRDTRDRPALPEPDEQTPDESDESAPNSFAAILDSLRTEEDTFYFQVETATSGRLRVPIEGTGMLLGWDATGQNVACGDARVVANTRAVVHKDWSGVMLQPEEAGAAQVNGEPVETARRLRNGDRVTLRPPAGSVNPDPARNFIIFYEPASLVVLDSLLPAQQLPPPVAPPPSAPAGALVPAPAAPLAVRPPARTPLTARTYFGYFTFGEVALMACATLVAAFIIFLILEYI